MIIRLTKDPLQDLKTEVQWKLMSDSCKPLVACRKRLWLRQVYTVHIAARKYVKERNPCRTFHDELTSADGTSSMESTTELEYAVPQRHILLAVADGKMIRTASLGCACCLWQHVFPLCAKPNSTLHGLDQPDCPLHMRTCVKGRLCAVFYVGLCTGLRSGSQTLAAPEYTRCVVVFT